MSQPVLLESTGDPAGDRIVRGVVGVFGQAFPVAGSCALLSPILLEIIVVSEHQLRQPDNHPLAQNLKHATRLLHGQDIRPELLELAAGAYLRSVVHTPYGIYSHPTQRRGSPVLTYPLRHLDPDGPFYGFDQWLIPGPDGTELPSTKLLVGTVGWTATAIVVLRTGRYVPDKRAGLDLYREHVADRWTGLVAGVHERCRDRWHYRVPDTAPERRELRVLCRRTLAFQNHFLRRYRRFQLAELRSGAADRQALAARRLGEVQFPDREVVDVLHQLRTDGEAAVREAAGAALAGYPAGDLDMRGAPT